MSEDDRSRQGGRVDLEGLDRRAFLGLAGSAAALLEGCARRDAVYIEQPLQRSGMAGASLHRISVCGQCGAGCHFDVRTVDGEGKKLEGLPSGPVNRGGLCALGQSALQEYYNPDRITQPMRRRGKRVAGSGNAPPTADQFEPISWEEALDVVGTALLNAARKGDVGDRPIGIVTGSGGGFVGALWRRLARGLGAPLPSAAEAPELAVERRAAELVLGRRALPVYDLAHSDWVLGLGAPMLDRWRSPVGYARGIALGRAGRSGRRAKLVQAESRQSLTAATADEWLPLRPGSEGLLARALAGVAIGSGEVEADLVAGYRRWFPAPAPSLEEAAERCGIEAATLRRIAGELMSAERPLVVAGGSAVSGVHGLGAAVAGLALNGLLGGIERGVGGGGGVTAGATFGLERELGEIEPLESMARLGSRLRGEAFPAVEVLLVSDSDPLHQAPAGWRFPELLSSVATVVVASAFLDDTALQADLVLPIQTDLERFNAVEPEPPIDRPAVMLSAPALETRGEARHPADVVLALARVAQSSLRLDFPWESFTDVVEAAIGSALEQGSGGERVGSVELPPFEGEGRVTASRYLGAALERGGIWGDRLSSAPVPKPEVSDGVTVTELLADPGREGEETEGDAESYPWRLLPFETVKTGDGRGANRPWLQELPDPLSSVMWGSWAELATTDAQRLGIATGDLLRLESPSGAIEVPAVVLPSVRPGCVAVPLGQGHYDFGRYARGRGVNPMTLVAGDLLVAGTESPVLQATRVRVERMGPAGARGAVIYGRGLRQAEHIPFGWAPHDVRGHEGDEG